MKPIVTKSTAGALVGAVTLYAFGAPDQQQLAVDHQEHIELRSTSTSTSAGITVSIVDFYYRR
jgi:hypothetical protein